MAIAEAPSAAESFLRDAHEVPRSAARDASTSSAVGPGRLVSLDAYRGLIMILMISAGLQIGKVVKTMDTTVGWQHLHTRIWDQLAYQTDHTIWTGCSLWDLIQPSFMFMVGVAMAFSLANRKARGESFGRMSFHALFRSLALVLLSIFLISNWGKQTDWAFTNVLAQIGLGYPVLFLVAWIRPRWQVVAALGILLAYWGASALYPAPPANLDLQSVHLPEDWTRLAGFSSHWEKNTNWAAHVDQVLLNIFPRVDGKRFEFSEGGYQTLNFVPSIATMIFGLLAGQLVRGRLSGAKKTLILFAVGAGALAGGWALGYFGICPICKRIWTPSWTIFSAGWTLLAMGVFYLVLDVWRLRGWEYPLLVVGANSIGIYCVSITMKPWVRETMNRHFGRHVHEIPGRVYAWLQDHVLASPPMPSGALDAYGRIFAPMVEAGFFLLFCWVLCWWAYRRRLFVKL
jgi:predicted acyltransferase